MKLGIQVRATDEGIDTRELARAVEAAGFESLFCADHPHIPVDRQSKIPNDPKGMHEREYFRLLDPIVNITAQAAVTTRLKLGTDILLVVERDPILLAKQVSTVEHFAGPRLILGVGAGWNREEMLNHGTDPKTRMTLMAERVEAMKKIWTEEEAEYHGRFVNFDPIYSWPKPVQKPYPPVLVGGKGPTVLDRVVRFGDGWIPPHHGDFEDLAQRLAELDQKADAAGRGHLPTSIHLPVTPDGPAEVDPRRYEDLGIERLIFQISAGPRDRTLAELAVVEHKVRPYLEQ